MITRLGTSAPSEIVVFFAEDYELDILRQALAGKIESLCQRRGRSGEMR